MRVILNGEEQEIRDDITVAELLHDLQIISAVWCGGGESSGGAEEEIMRRPTSEPGIASRSYARWEVGNVDGQGEDR